MTMRTRLLLGAALLLGIGLLAEWALRAPPTDTPQTTQVPAPAAPPAAPPEAASLSPAPGAPAAALSAPVSTQPLPAAVEEDEAVRGVPHDNDPIEPELPQTPEWKLEKTAHLSRLMDRHVARLQAEQAEAQAAGKLEEAKRLEVAAARAQRRLASLQAEMASLQAQSGAVATQ